MKPARHVFIDPRPQDPEDEYTYCLVVFPRNPTWWISTIRLYGNTEIDAQAIEVAEQRGWLVLRGLRRVLTFTVSTAPTTREICDRMVQWGGIVTRCFNARQSAEEKKQEANGCPVVRRRMTILEAEEGLLLAEVKASPFSDD